MEAVMVFRYADRAMRLMGGCVEACGCARCKRCWNPRGVAELWVCFPGFCMGEPRACSFLAAPWAKSPAPLGLVRVWAGFGR